MHFLTLVTLVLVTFPLIPLPIKEAIEIKPIYEYWGVSAFPLIPLPIKEAIKMPRTL